MNERSFNVKALCFLLTIWGNIGRRRPRLSGERGVLARSSRQPAANSRCQPVLPGNRTERWTLNVGRWTFAS